MVRYWENIPFYLAEAFALIKTPKKNPYEKPTQLKLHFENRERERQQEKESDIEESDEDGEFYLPIWWHCQNNQSNKSEN